jgi:hypothetical protein
MIRNRLPFCAFLVCLFGVIVRGQGILVWNDTTGLPACAYECNDLYAAQFECPTGAGGLGCFCGSAVLVGKPVGWGCDDVCTGWDRERVANFLGATCEGVTDESKTSMTDMSASASTTLATPTPTSESTSAAGISTPTSASAILVTSTAREPTGSTTGTVNRNVPVETAHNSANSSNAYGEDQANKALCWYGLPACDVQLIITYQAGGVRTGHTSFLHSFLSFSSSLLPPSPVRFTNAFST